MPLCPRHIRTLTAVRRLPFGKLRQDCDQAGQFSRDRYVNTGVMWIGYAYFRHQHPLTDVLTIRLPAREGSIGRK